MPNKIYGLDIHDYGLLLPGNDSLLSIKQHYKNFKITAFTIPLPKEFFDSENQKHFNRKKYEEWAEIVNSYDWLEIGVHGFSHTKREFDCTYQKAEMMIKAWENLWGEIGLKYSKIFCAPYWQYSYDSLNALKDYGYIVAVDRNHPIVLPEGLKTYTYNWSFEEKMPNKDIILGHGHAYPGAGVKNAIGDCYINITNQIPDGAEFDFITKLYDKKTNNKEKKENS